MKSGWRDSRAERTWKNELPSMKRVFHRASLIGNALWVSVACGRYQVWMAQEANKISLELLMAAERGKARDKPARPRTWSADIGADSAACPSTPADETRENIYMSAGGVISGLI